MTRSEQGGEPRRRLSVEHKSERRTGKIQRSCSPHSFSTRFLAVAIAALGLALSPVAPANAQPTTGFTTTSSGNLQPNIPNAIPGVQLAPVGATAQCGDSTMKAVRDRHNKEAVPVACSLTLGPKETISRKIEFSGSAASGATLECTCDSAGCTTLQGGINIRGIGTDRPENITVRNCTITGDVKLENPNRCPDPPTCADTQPDFVEWVRARAPRRITFDNITITGTGKDRFYVGWGATETKLINSVIEGEATGVPIYLAPHSSGTLIKNNQIRTVTKAPGLFRTTEREAIAIDGSDHNHIISNWFGALNRGGIYVFRNCGENGGIRHTTPSHNHIINNVFPYKKYNGPNPAVFLGSRDGNPPGFEADIPVVGTVGSYCDDDKGFPFGSSADDRDFATHNVVMQNQIVKRRAADVIRSKNWANNAMNLIDRNPTVKLERAKWPRPSAGCYVRGGAKEFILHGGSTEKFMRDDGSPTCERVTCHDGELRPAPTDVATRTSTLVRRPSAPVRTANVCNTRRVRIDCRIRNNNKGCHKTVSCPAGKKVVGAVAACNLEYGAVSDSELATVPPHLIHVAKLSDGIKGGRCYVGSNAVIGQLSYSNFTLRVPRSAVQTPIRGIAGRRRVAVGCDEHDGNGGDCHIRGSLYCR
ncbi:hypothetical protein BH10PSE7_BH10PSE7_19530 [soil metagenome]